MAGITRQKHASKPQRLGHKAAQGGNAFLDRWAGNEFFSAFVVQAQAQFLPERVVRPLFHLVGQWHLQVVAAARQAALGAQRKAARAVHVNEFVVHRGGVRQHAQPAKGVHLFVLLDGVARGAGAAHAVKAIAAGNEITFNLVTLSVFLVCHTGPGGVEIVHRHFARLINGRQVGGHPGVHQVFGHVGLAVNDHVFATCELVHVHTVALAAVQQLKPTMHQALLVHARAHASLVQQVTGDLLQHAGPDAAEHVVG